MYKGQSISVIIPAHNEAPRIPKVLRAFLKSKLVDKIIVVDDGSTDSLQRIVSRVCPQAIFLRNKTNQGKAAAVIKGLSKSTSTIVFLADADYNNLNLTHIDSSLKFFVNHRLDMLLLPTYTVTLFDMVGSHTLLTGLRIIKRSLLTKARIPRHIGFGLEMFLNKSAVAKGWKIDIMSWPPYVIPPINPLKTKKTNLATGIQGQLLMLKQMHKVGSLPEYLSQYRRLVIEGYHLKKIALQLQNLSQGLFINDSFLHSQNPR